MSLDGFPFRQQKEYAVCEGGLDGPGCKNTNEYDALPKTTLPMKPTCDPFTFRIYPEQCGGM
jgi:hypothetical protein